MSVAHAVLQRTIRSALAVFLLPLAAFAQEEPDSAKKDEGKPDLGPMRTIEFTVEEGTWTGLDVAPDGRTIVFDLLGDLYTVPIEGGDASLLVGGRDWDHMPRFSPDGSRIAFISDRDGNMNVWLMNADGTEPKALSKERTNQMRSPAWTPDGRFVIAYKGARGNASGLFQYHVDGGTGFQVDSANGQGPAFSPDGRFLYFSQGGIRRLDRRSGEAVRLTHGSGGGVRPVVSPDGRWLAYGRQHDHETALHVRDLRTGADRMLMRPITPRAGGNQDELPAYAFTPDSRSVVLTVGGKIQRVDVATGAVAAIPFRAHVSQQVAEVLRHDRRIDDGPLDARVMRWPSLSPDRSRLVFSALGKLYASDVPAPVTAAESDDGDATPSSSDDDAAASSGAPGRSPPVVSARRLTTADEREYTPVWSPDGNWIAYTTWSDAELGHLRLRSADGRRTRTLSTIPGRYTNPVWSPDGTKIAFVRGSGVEMRGGMSDDEPYVEIVWLPVAEGGEPRYVTAAPYGGGFALRYYPVLSFSPDGERIYFTERSSGGSPTAGQRTTLQSIRLDGTDKRGHLRFVPVDEVIPSPDGRHVAFARRENIVVAEIPAFTTSPIEISFDGGALPVKKLTREGGVFVQWLDETTLGWSFTDTYYTQDIEADSAQALAQVSLTVPRSAPDGVVAFTNARIVTMDGDAVIENGTLVVEDNRITAMGPAGAVQVPGNARTIDATGKTIVPGLVDTHAHMHYASMEFHPQQKWEYVAQLAYGTTTTFDPSAHNLDVFPQYEMVESGEMLGPRIYSTGDVIYGTESVFPVVYESIGSIEDARHVVRRYKGYDPLMLKEYMQPRRDQRQWLRQAAAEEGIPITAEGGADMVLDLTLVLDGYTAVEHSLPIEIHEDVVQLFARAGTNYTPTLTVAYGGPSVELYFHNQKDFHDDPKLRRFVPESELDSWRRHQRIPEEEWHFRTVARGAADIFHAGGSVTVGAHGQLQGLGTLWELWGMAMGGLTPLEAIRTGTYDAAVKLGLADDIGMLRPGMLADFIVLDANPLDDIYNLEAQRYVVKNGFVYEADTMTEVWPGAQPLEPWFWMSDQDRARWWVGR